MDELAYELGIDPVELRLRNHTAVDPRGNPWSSDGLPQCLRLGAERFGWPVATRRRAACATASWLIGTGMAAAAYPMAFFMPEQRARARIHADGSAVVQTATQEFGTGVLTMATQVGADALGVELAAMTSRPATATFPTARRPSARWERRWSAPRCTPPATALRRQLIELAIGDEASPLHGASAESVDVAGGRMTSAERPGAGDTYGELLARSHMADAEAMGSWRPPPLDSRTGILTFGAQFAEVAVDPELGLVRVRRLLGVFAPGRVLNPLLARSQLMGGMLWGLGQALLEGNHMDRAPRPLGGEQPRGVSRSGQRRRPRRHDRVRRRARRRSSARSVPRASARSARSEPPRRSPTRCSTPPAAAIRELPMAPELVMDPAGLAARSLPAASRSQGRPRPGCCWWSRSPRCWRWAPGAPSARCSCSARS